MLLPPAACCIVHPEQTPSSHPSCATMSAAPSQRGDELDLIPHAFDRDGVNCSYLAYSPLSGGVLSGKYAPVDMRSNKPGTAAKAQKRSRLGLFRGYSQSFLETAGPQAVSAYSQVVQGHFCILVKANCIHSANPNPNLNLKLNPNHVTSTTCR